jgi:hypothetical protein
MREFAPARTSSLVVRIAWRTRGLVPGAFVAQNIPPHESVIFPIAG